MKEAIKVKILSISDKIFEKAHSGFESNKSYKIISSLLVYAFLILLVLIFFNNLGIFPDSLTDCFPKNYFFAVEIVFKLLLTIEVIAMVFVLAYSVSESVAKQFEILSLILLRQAFKVFSNVENPLEFAHDYTQISYILSDIFGALLIFLGLYIFKKLQKHRPITVCEKDKSRFISLKKLLSLSMILTFIGIGIYDLTLYLSGIYEFQFFLLFYTVLIFTDILIVIIALRYSHSYNVVFRNTGFAIATILIRIALSGSHYFDAILGVVAMIYAIVMSIIYNKFEVKNKLREF